MPLAIRDEPLPLVEDENDNGLIKIRGTRITLDIVVTAFLAGETAEEIVEQYDTLSLADVYSVVGYYLHHRAEVNEYLRVRREEANALRQEIERRIPRDGLRERLLARRATQP